MHSRAQRGRFEEELVTLLGRVGREEHLRLLLLQNRCRVVELWGVGNNLSKCYVNVRFNIIRFPDPGSAPAPGRNDV